MTYPKNVLEMRAHWQPIGEAALVALNHVLEATAAAAAWPSLATDRKGRVKLPKRTGLLSFDDHVALGDALRFLRGTLFDAGFPNNHVSIWVQSSDFWKRLDRGIDLLDHAKHRLEELMFNAFPEQGTVHVYYGPKKVAA